MTALDILREKEKQRFRKEKIETPKKVNIGKFEIDIIDCFRESNDTIVIIMNNFIIQKVHKDGVRVAVRGSKPANIYFFESGKKGNYLPVTDAVIQNLVHLTLHELRNILPIYSFVHSHFRKK